MKNKVLIELFVPSIEKSFDVYIPVSRRIGNVIGLLNKSLFEITNGLFTGNENTALYSTLSGKVYEPNAIVKDTDIRNGSKIILM